MTNYAVENKGLSASMPEREREREPVPLQTRKKRARDTPIINRQARCNSAETHMYRFSP